MILSSDKNPSEMTKMVSFYNLSMPQCKEPQMMQDKSASQNYLPSSKSFSFVGNVLTRLVNIFKTVETRSIPLDKNCQFLSAPDILVDKSIGAPVFETKYGMAKLTLPDGTEIASKQTKSLSVGNSPFDWCPIHKNGFEHNKQKRIKTKSREMCKRKECSIKSKRCLNIQAHHMGKDKNIKKKHRHSVMSDMIEDYGQMTDGSDLDSDFEYSDAKYERAENNEVCLTPALILKAPLSFSEDSFPEIRTVSHATRKTSVDRRNLPSEYESDDSFVVFSDDVPFTTPSASPVKRKDLCTALNSFFNPGSLRQRQLSECSDDSIVFCDESDAEQLEFRGSFSSDDTEETDDENCTSDSGDRISHQPDSGFEEKKVRFNLKPEVHVMRTWDFAYRKARKGEWEMAARDRERFKMRIDETEQILKPVFEKNVRDRIYSERLSNLS